MRSLLIWRQWGLFNDAGILSFCCKKVMYIMEDYSLCIIQMEQAIVSKKMWQQLISAEHIILTLQVYNDSNKHISFIHWLQLLQDWWPMWFVIAKWTAQENRPFVLPPSCLLHFYKSFVQWQQHKGWLYVTPDIRWLPHRNQPSFLLLHGAEDGFFFFWLRQVACEGEGFYLAFANCIDRHCCNSKTWGGSIKTVFETAKQI